MEGLLKSAVGYHRLPLVRQIGLLVGLSASIALGFYIVLWSKDPNYRPVYSQLSPQETSEVLDALQASGIPFKVDQSTGSVLVPADDVYNARFKLAGSGLPANNGGGFEMLDKDSGIGTSRFMESARYKRALEGELARTISSVHNVRSARVHLALPKDSVFVNDKQKPSASVFLDVGSGSLTPKQVAAIQQLVAASIPNLEGSGVSVVDQSGQLLSTGSSDKDFEINNQQLQYTKQLEQSYEKNIINLLSPLVGSGNIKASVTAAVDFAGYLKSRTKIYPRVNV